MVTWLNNLEWEVKDAATATVKKKEKKKKKGVTFRRWSKCPSMTKCVAALICDALASSASAVPIPHHDAFDILVFTYVILLPSCTG